jgi:hypothetical protein
VVLSDPNDN